MLRIIGGWGYWACEIWKQSSIIHFSLTLQYSMMVPPPLFFKFHILQHMLILTSDFILMCFYCATWQLNFIITFPKMTFLNWSSSALWHATSGWIHARLLRRTWRSSVKDQSVIGIRYIWVRIQMWVTEAAPLAPCAWVIQIHFRGGNPVRSALIYLAITP